MPVASQTNLYTAEDQWNDLVGVAKEPPPPESAPAPAPAPTTSSTDPAGYYESNTAPPSSPPPPPPPAAAGPDMSQDTQAAQAAPESIAPAASTYYGGASPEGQAVNTTQTQVSYPASGAPDNVYNTGTAAPAQPAALTTSTPSTDTGENRPSYAVNPPGSGPHDAPAASYFGPDMWQGRDIQNSPSPNTAVDRRVGPSLSPQVNERGSARGFMNPGERKEQIASGSILPDQSTYVPHENTNAVRTSAQDYGINVSKAPGQGLADKSPGPVAMNFQGDPVPDRYTEQSMFPMWKSWLDNAWNTAAGVGDYFNDQNAGYHDQSDVHHSVDTRVSVPGIGGTQDYNERRPTGEDISSRYYDPTGLPHVDHQMPGSYLPVIEGGGLAAPAAAPTTAPASGGPSFPGSDRARQLLDEIGAASADNTVFGQDTSGVNQWLSDRGDTEADRQRVLDLINRAAPYFGGEQPLPEADLARRDGGGPRSVRGHAVDTQQGGGQTANQSMIPTTGNAVLDAAGQWLSDRGDTEADRQRVIGKANEVAGAFGGFAAEHAPSGGGGGSGGKSGEVGGTKILMPDGSIKSASETTQSEVAGPGQRPTPGFVVKGGDIQRVSSSPESLDAVTQRIAKGDLSQQTAWLSAAEFDAMGYPPSMKDEMVTPTDASGNPTGPVKWLVIDKAEADKLTSLGGATGTGTAQSVSPSGGGTGSTGTSGTSGTVDSGVAANGSGGSGGSTSGGSGVDYYSTGGSGSGGSSHRSSGRSYGSGGGADYYAPAGFGSDSGGGDSWADDPIFSAFFDVLDKSNPAFAAKVRSMFQQSGRGSGIDFGSSGSRPGSRHTSRRSRSRRSGKTGFGSGSSPSTTRRGTSSNRGTTGTGSSGSTNGSRTSGSSGSGSTPPSSREKTTRRSGK